MLENNCDYHIFSLSLQKNRKDMKKREELFREKAEKYVVCHSERCPLREHCLRAILSHYVPENRPVTTSVNLNNPLVQTEQCSFYRSDEIRRMPVGLTWLCHDMPGWQEHVIKGNLMRHLTRTGYYRYRNGSRPITPDVEAYIRQLLKAHGITQEPHFDGYTEDYVW